ncbi:hypothetical protein AVEN_162679-1 [Araneus ventricosus]|uniref:Mos1 transposase HTH domain-containing protein n=1 Tax=Araneus ventricosus TaxID=182803 RepID=A0A4Y2WWK8_ARAVE|nr:hypothetical protein AVEN_92026-1 [Araneus ventricosus]GBO41294.1 hypothetical protein AVEN_162679-1 [Araneus ventricosus]
MGHREAIPLKRPSMLSDVVIFLHDNTDSARQTQELLQKFKWKVWRHLLPFSPHLTPNMGSKHLSETRFASSSGVKTGAENWLSGQGCD